MVHPPVDRTFEVLALDLPVVRDDLEGDEVPLDRDGTERDSVVLLREKGSQVGERLHALFEREFPRLKHGGHAARVGAQCNNKLYHNVS